MNAPPPGGASLPSPHTLRAQLYPSAGRADAPRSRIRSIGSPAFFSTDDELVGVPLLTAPSWRPPAPESFSMTDLASVSPMEDEIDLLAQPTGLFDRCRAYLFRRHGYESLAPTSPPKEPAICAPVCNHLPSLLLRLVIASVLGSCIWLVHRTSQFRPGASGFALYASLSDDQLTRLFGSAGHTSGPGFDAVGLAAPVQLHDPYRSASLSYKFGVDPEPQPSADLSNDFVPIWYPGNDAESATGSSLKPIALQKPLVSRPECLEAWVAHGQVCAQLDTRKGGGGLHEPKVDVLYTWVNGSEIPHRQIKSYWDYCMTTDSPVAQQVCPQGYVQGPKGPMDRFNDLQLEIEPDEAMNNKFCKFLKDVYPILVSQSMDPNQQLRNSNQDVHRHSIGIQDRRFTELDELRYAVRSAVRYIPNLGTIHVLSPDFSDALLPDIAAAGAVEAELRKSQYFFSTASVPAAHELEKDIKASLDRWQPSLGSPRAGQKPRWLNVSSSHVLTGEKAEMPGKDDEVAPLLRLHHDWSLFRPGPFPGGTSPLDVARTSIAAPTFNSMAVEAIFEQSNVAGLGDIMFVASDDFFFLRRLSTADVASPLFGLVMRLSDTIDVRVSGSQVGWSIQGEGPGLEVSAYLLNQRFGVRNNRRHSPHVHRSADASLLHEMRLMFREALTVASKARFRGLGLNVVSHTLFSSMVVERHREALLWSYIVLTLDANGDGKLDGSEINTLLQAMGRTSDGHPGARLPRRGALSPAYQKNLSEATGLPLPLETEYRFASADGYALPRLDVKAMRQWILPPFGRHSQDFALQGGWPYYLPTKERPEGTPPQPWDNEADEGGQRTVCTFKADVCFPASNGPVDAAETFVHIAFAHPECGDCLATHLVQQSGRHGLAAALPPEGRVFPSSDSNEGITQNAEQVPHLPLTRTWRAHEPRQEQKGDVRHSPRFAASDVGKATGWTGMSMRGFALRLLQRYAYTLGTTEMDFIIYTEESGRRLLEEAELNPDLALLCVNDDLIHHKKEPVDFLHSFLERRLPRRASEVSFEL